MMPRRALLGLATLLLAPCLNWAQDLPEPLVVVLIGPPASGKSTQGEYLNQKYKLPVISIEELVAERAGGRRPGSDLDRGDPAIDEMVRERVSSLPKGQGFTLDGYPSTLAQAEFLGKLVRDLSLPNPIVIQIHIPDRVAHERSQIRGGPDDAPEIVARRIEEYHRELGVVRDYYPGADIWTIDGTRDPEGVSATIRMLIEDRMDQ